MKTALLIVVWKTLHSYIVGKSHLMLNYICFCYNATLNIYLYNLCEVFKCCLLITIVEMAS